MDNKTIVAIEIASSKIKGAVGTVSSDGHVTVQAVEEIPGQGNVRYGRVQNIREVSAAVSDMLHKLEESDAVAPRHIRSLTVSLGGRSLGSIASKASLTFTKECEITTNQVDRLSIEANNDIVGDRCIEATIPRMYYVNNSAVRQPIGTYGESLKGEFTIVTCAKETRQNLSRLRFDGIEPENTAFTVTPLAIADFVLTQEEKSIGTALVDFGAETTTVAVYKDGSLAFLCTIPMGARLISRDLMTAFTTTEENANEIIREYSRAGKDTNKDAGNYIHARAGEIVANVQHQLEAAGFGKDTIGKAVLTGGATNIPDIPEQFESYIRIKTRIAEMPSNVTFRVAGRNNADNIDIVALLAASAPLFRDDCLTNIEFTDESEQDDEPVVIRQDQTGKPAVANEEIDDDDILKDDEDEDDKSTKEKKGFRSFFGIGKRKDKKQIDIDDIEDNTAPEKDSAEEEEIVQTKETENPKETTRNLKKAYTDFFERIFTHPEGLYYDDEEENDK